MSKRKETIIPIKTEINETVQPNIVCSKCKKVSNFDGCKEDSDLLISKVLKQNKDFDSISHHSFDLFGVCKKCSSSYK